MPDRTGVENKRGARPYLFEHCDGKGGDARFVWQPGAEKHDISALGIGHQLHGGNRIDSTGRGFRNSEHQRFRDCYSERGWHAEWYRGLETGDRPWPDASLVPEDES